MLLQSFVNELTSQSLAITLSATPSFCGLGSLYQLFLPKSTSLLLLVVRHGPMRLLVTSATLVVTSALLVVTMMFLLAIAMIFLSFRTQGVEEAARDFTQITIDVSASAMRAI